jgi:hypothetical protein
LGNCCSMALDIQFLIVKTVGVVETELRRRLNAWNPPNLVIFCINISISSSPSCAGDSFPIICWSLLRLESPCLCAESPISMKNATHLPDSASTNAPSCRNRFRQPEQYAVLPKITRAIRSLVVVLSRMSAKVVNQSWSVCRE